MCRFKRGELAIAAFLLLFFTIFNAAAATDVFFDVQQVFGTLPPNNTNRIFRLQSLSPFQGNFFYRTSDISGQFYVSNCLATTYSGTMLAPPNSLTFSFYVSATNLGTIPAVGITAIPANGAQTFPAGQTAYSAQASDQRYAPIGSGPFAGLTAAQTTNLVQNATNSLLQAITNSIDVSVIRADNLILPFGNAVMKANSSSNAVAAVAGTDYDAPGAALAIGLAATNYTLATSNALQAQIGSAGISLVTATNIATNQVFLGTNGIGIPSGLSAFVPTNRFDPFGAATAATNGYTWQTNGKSPYHFVINVKAAPYNAVGNGVADDWTAIQTAITTACLATNSPVSVYIPAGTYRLTNTISLTTQTNGGNTTGDTSISELFGDGARQTFLNFTNKVGNGIEFRLNSGDQRHLSNFSLHDLAVFGPSVADGTTNATGSGFFFGYNSDLLYGGDTPGWHDSVYNCQIEGWRNGIAITNSVFFTIRNCNLKSNVLHSVLLAHADTTRLENNNYGFPVFANQDLSAIYVARDKSGISAAVLSAGGECGNSAVVVYNEGGTFAQTGGNFERNTKMLVASNYCISTFEACRIANTDTNYQFEFHNGGGAFFYAANCMLDAQTNVFNQIPGPDVFIEYPIHYLLNLSPTNGVWNSSTYRAYPAVTMQPTVTVSGGVVLNTLTNGNGSPNYSLSLSSGVITNAIGTNLQTGLVANQILFYPTNDLSIQSNALVAQISVKANTNSPTIFTPSVNGGIFNAPTNGTAYFSGGGFGDSSILNNALGLLVNPSGGANTMSVSGSILVNTNIRSAFGIFIGNGIGLTNTSATNIALNALTQVTNIASSLIGASVGITNAIGTNFPNGNISSQTLYYPTNFVNPTNGFAINPTFTNLTTIEGNIAFGPLGGATNFYGSTNILKVFNAGTAIATNGTLIWNSSLNCYTNWSTGSIYTNNGSAWLLQTNGVTLYSVSGSNPAGSSSAVSGAAPSPSVVVSGYFDGNGIAWLGPLSVTNITTLINTIATNNFVAQNGGFATNLWATNATFSWSTAPAINVVNNGGTMNFQAMSAGLGNTNISSGFGAAILSGATNRLNADGGAIIVGGAYNTITGGSGNNDVIVGGAYNTLVGSAGISSVDGNFIGAGMSNSIQNVSIFSFIGAGMLNSAQGNYTTTLGGLGNTNINGRHSVIAGGAYNRIEGSGFAAFDGNFIGAGTSNSIKSVSTYVSILGGFLNSAFGNYTVNLGGFGNTNLQDGSVILGGSTNRNNGKWSVAAGRNVTISHDNVFSWSDGIADTSTTNSQFRITGTNGLYVNGPITIGLANTNSGLTIASNTFALWPYTNHLGVGDYTFANSNGVPVILWNSNATVVMKNVFP